MRKKPRFHSLKKLRVRQDWSRWSLYSISQLKPPNLTTRTYFQQKWTAKSTTRAYHGEQIREKKWKRQFRRNLPAVVPMDYKFLARHDGSEQAAGRGAGADLEDTSYPPPMTPYMQMTYYPIERRLDTAVFRAMFASSARQARQFCVHGLVKVNGKKMPYPGYMLNPGDLFQVEPSAVLYATGAPKNRSSRGRKILREKAAARAEARAKNPPKPRSIQEFTPAREEPTPQELKEHMETLMQNVENVLNEDISARNKQKFRALRKQIRKSIGLWKTASPESVSTLDSQFNFLKSAFESRTTKESPKDEPTSLISAEDKEKLRQAFEKLKEKAEYTSEYNKHDPEAPYKTPWRPRDYMSAFAFIPRYLEVNQNICAAVYLRHPVARPGLAEVPTPFHIETGQLAFNWYLRRR